VGEEGGDNGKGGKEKKKREERKRGKYEVHDGVGVEDVFAIDFDIGIRMFPWPRA